MPNYSFSKTRLPNIFSETRLPKGVVNTPSLDFRYKSSGSCDFDAGG